MGFSFSLSIIPIPGHFISIYLLGACQLFVIFYLKTICYYCCDCFSLRSPENRVQRTSWRVTLIFIQCVLILLRFSQQYIVLFLFFSLCLYHHGVFFLIFMIFKNITYECLAFLKSWFYRALAKLISKKRGILFSFVCLIVWYRSNFQKRFQRCDFLAFEDAFRVDEHELMPQSTFLDSADRTMSFLLLTQR